MQTDLSQVWTYPDWGGIERRFVPQLKVRVIKEHGCKTREFFERAKGLIFGVINKRPSGYDVDLAPLGHPGVMGFLFDGQVEEVDFPVSLIPRKKDIERIAL